MIPYPEVEEGLEARRFSVGKLPVELLGRLLERYRLEDERVVLGARIGEDAAVLDIGDRYLVAKADPITFASDQIGWYAVHVNTNDLVTTGARPLWFLATVLLPERRSDEALVDEIFRQMHGACAELGVSLVGGHTEITYGLERPIVVGHMLGEVDRDKLVTTAGAQVGDAVVLTKGVAIEGTAIMAREREGYLLDRGYSSDFIERAQRYLYEPGISVFREAMLASSSFDVHAMHDPTEGGLAMGLYELAEAAGVGLSIEADEVRVLPECRKLCDEFALDPLGTIASGALLVALPPGQAQELKAVLYANDVTASIIGHVRPVQEGIKLQRDGSITDLPRFSQDEIARLFT